MVKNVEEAAKGRIAVMPQPFPRVLGDVHRQRAIGAEEPEQTHLQAGNPALRRLERRQRRRRKRQVRILAEAHRLVDGAQGTAPSRLVAVQALELP